jgi:hypothetical protein
MATSDNARYVNKWAFSGGAAGRVLTLDSLPEFL